MSSGLIDDVVPVLNEPVRQTGINEWEYYGLRNLFPITVTCRIMNNIVFFSDLNKSEKVTVVAFIIINSSKILQISIWET